MRPSLSVPTKLFSRLLKYGDLLELPQVGHTDFSTSIVGTLLFFDPLGRPRFAIITPDTTPVVGLSVCLQIFWVWCRRIRPVILAPKVLLPPHSPQRKLLLNNLRSDCLVCAGTVSIRQLLAPYPLSLLNILRASDRRASGVQQASP